VAKLSNLDEINGIDWSMEIGGKSDTNRSVRPNQNRALGGVEIAFRGEGDLFLGETNYRCLIMKFGEIDLGHWAVKSAVAVIQLPRLTTASTGGLCSAQMASAYLGLGGNATSPIGLWHRFLVINDTSWSSPSHHGTLPDLPLP
jgi:hypothetical protein